VPALRWLSVIILLFGGISSALALELNRDLQQVDLSSHVSLLEDPSGRLGISDVAGADYATKFKPWDATRGSINLGYTSSSLWVRLVLSRQADSPEDWLLEVPYAYNKYLDFYDPNSSAVYTGTGRPVSTRPLFDRFFLFPVSVTADPQVYYFRVASNYAVSLPLRIWQPQAYTEYALKANLANALYYGGLLALTIYNLFLFFSLKDQRFLYYALFALFLNAGIFSGNGLMQLFIWPDWSDFHEVGSQLLISLSGFAALRFCRLFLQTDQHSPLIGVCMRTTEWMFVLLAALLLWSVLTHFSPQFLFIVLTGLGVFGAALIAAASIQAVRNGVSGIRFFLIAWGIFLTGILISACRLVGLLPTNTFTSYAIQIASGAEMLLLSLALAEIVQTERRVRLEAQAEAFSAKERMIVALQAAEQRLEGAVLERTKRLQESVLRERHLLGQYLRFGAMISHEFRNPLGIIDSQATLIQRSTGLSEDLLTRITIIRRTVQRLAKLFELWLSGDRIRLAIDRLEVRKIPLQPWTEALVKKIPYCSETHAIRLEMSTSTDSGSIWANADLLEMALINLIENACKYSPAGSPVVLKEVRTASMSGISVADRGPGISSDHLARLGEDYYRADPNGPSGIGLGLSVVKEIAALHDGKLEIESELGKGSRFTILLPVRESGHV
jgi:signal transduction histidine kinase